MIIKHRDYESIKATICEVDVISSWGEKITIVIKEGELGQFGVEVFRLSLDDSVDVGYKLRNPLKIASEGGHCLIRQHFDSNPNPRPALIPMGDSIRG